MTALKVKQSRLQRTLQHVPASTIGANLFSKFLHQVDPHLMRMSGGRFSVPGSMVGLPIVMLTSTGSKSGKSRTMPVIGVPDGLNIALVASNWGQTKNPAWYYNLRTNPIAELEFDGQTGTYRAREITDHDEYERLWQKAGEVYIGFEKYQRRTGDRQIPIMLLESQTDSTLSTPT